MYILSHSSEAGSPRSKYEQDHAPSEGSKKNFSLLTSGSFLAYGHITPSHGTLPLCMKVKGKVLVTQSCLTLYDPMDCSPPDSCAHGILQAGVLEWVVIPFSRGFPNPGIEPGSPT